MSKLPTPKTLPKPKGSRGDSEITTVEHDELLRWAWNNLDTIIADSFLISKKWLAEQVKKEQEDYFRSLRYTECQLRDKAQENGGNGDAIKFNAIADQFARFCGAVDIPAIPDEVLHAKVIERYFQQPLPLLFNGEQFGKNEPVGFVDIMAVTKHVFSISLSKPSCAFRYGYSMRAEDTPPIFKAEQPEWDSQTTQRRVLIDVRVTLPSTGQLIRELRTLQAMESYASILLVVDEIDLDVENIVREAGFWVCCRDDYEDVPE